MKKEGVLQNNLPNPTEKHSRMKQNKNPTRKIRDTEGPEMVVAVPDHHGWQREKVPRGCRALSQCSSMVQCGTA